MPQRTTVNTGTQTQIKSQDISPYGKKLGRKSVWHFLYSGVGKGVSRGTGGLPNRMFTRDIMLLPISNLIIMYGGQ